MKIELKNFKLNGEKIGYVAHFDVLLDDVVMVRDLTLQRPEKFPDEAWLMLPALARDDRRSAWFENDLRAAIGQRAAAAFSAVSGIDLEYVAPRRGRLTEEEAVEEAKKPAGKPKAVISNWLDRHEADDAGLKRVLCAGGEESLEKAGI